MAKAVLNTTILNETGSSGGGINPGAEKFVFWGATLKTESFNSQDILGLVNKEQRADRLFVDAAWDSKVGESRARLIAAFPEDYVSTGRFEDLNTGFPYQFDSKGKVQITDDEGNTYLVDVFLWRNESFSTIGLKAL